MRRTVTCARWAGRRWLTSPAKSGKNAKDAGKLDGEMGSWTGNAEVDAVIEGWKRRAMVALETVAKNAGRPKKLMEGYALSQGQSQSYESLRDTIRRLDSSMQYKEYHTLRWTAGFMSVATFVLYFYRDEVKMWFGTTSADITSRTLGDEGVQREAQNLAQGVVYQLLNDAHALRLTTEFLNQLLEREPTRQAVIDLLSSVAAREETKAMLHDLFVRILTSPDFINQASIFFQNILQKESTKDALRNLFQMLYEDENMQKITAEFFSHVMNSETFRDTVYQLGMDTSHQVMNDPNVAKHAVSWINSVLGEPDLHSKAGDAIWGAITSTFIPGFLGGGRSKKEIVNIDEAMASLRKAKDQQGKSNNNPQAATTTSAVPSSNSKQQSGEAATMPQPSPPPDSSVASVPEPRSKESGKESSTSAGESSSQSNTLDSEVSNISVLGSATSFPQTSTSSLKTATILPSGSSTSEGVGESFSSTNVDSMSSSTEQTPISPLSEDSPAVSSESAAAAAKALPKVDTKLKAIVIDLNEK